MILDEGITLINADPAAGKSAYFKEPKHEGKYVFLAPLRAIVFSGGNTKNSLDDGIGTWNQIKSIVREKIKVSLKIKYLLSMKHMAYIQIMVLRMVQSTN